MTKIKGFIFCALSLGLGFLCTINTMKIVNVINGEHDVDSEITIQKIINEDSKIIKKKKETGRSALVIPWTIMKILLLKSKKKNRIKKFLLKK